jgi:hypothetical protein
MPHLLGIRLIGLIFFLHFLDLFSFLAEIDLFVLLFFCSMGRRGGGAARGGARGQSQSARKPALPHTEAYQRMNFLYHAAHQVVATNPALSRLYIRNMVLVAKKLVLRMYHRPAQVPSLFFFFNIFLF